MADPDEGSGVVRYTSDLIQFDTTNHGGGDGRERPAAEYVAASLAAAGIEPLLLEKAPGRTNVVARVPGTEPHRGALLVHGHLDVVPADPARWRRPPFSGDVHDGMVWGRGAIDMKGTVAMILAAVCGWGPGTRPRRDLVLAFTADEEDTAEYGAGWLVRQHPHLFEGCTEAVGESGGYTIHAAPGVRVYPIGAGERGTAWMRLTARGRAGHGSRVNADNAVTKLANAVTRIGAYRWPARLTPVVRAAIEELSAAVGVHYGPDTDLDDPSTVDGLAAALGGAAPLVMHTIRNSANPTGLAAGGKVNVVPGEATALVDGRVLPGTQEEFERTIDELLGADVSWEYVHNEIPLAAPIASPTFAAMRAALLEAHPGAYAVPYCMAGGTDAKQFSRLGIACYGFAPLRLPPGFEYHAMYHGVDERVPVDGLEFGTRVLDRFLSTC
jgi:acetylornithine deacetylase/succinyl-diaminopimelate desuccinylase-like protein